MNGINRNLGKGNPIATLAGPETFLSLDSEMQDKIISSIVEDRKGGIMGKFLGTEPTNVSMHIALILCVLLLVILGIDFFHAYSIEKEVNMDLVGTIIPVVTLSLGYIFGKGSTKS